jgi:2-hydroxy-3-oxopropionate reductase
VLRAVGRTITHLGPPGAGQVCKAANQLIISATMLAVSEAFALGRKAGLDPEVMRGALLGGSARSAVLEVHARRMLAGAFDPPGFRAELMRKDLRLALGAARERGVFAPATALAGQMLEALCNSGRARLDNAAIAALVAELSGLAGTPEG